MTQILVSISVWLPAVATVIFIGHYLLLSVIYLPVLLINENRTTLSQISRRSRPWLYASLLVCIVTGTYLMLIDPGYLGFMNLGNLWGMVMLVKHILIFAMIAMGFWFNAILRVGPMMSSKTGAAQAIARFRQYSNAIAISVLCLVPIPVYFGKMAIE
jgi:uncharacterized membrane protein